MAGGVYGSNNENSSYYLYTNQNYWLGSPESINGGFASGLFVLSSGSLYSNFVDDAYGARPVVSLSSKAKLSGSGTNKTYRMICKEFGAALVVGEMVSDKAIMFGNEKTKKLLDMDERERPISQQIFGSDKESFCIAAKKVYEYMHPDIIDINMGCPVPKIAIKSQAGSALLKSPEKIYEIVKAVKESVPCPITVKIRSGWDENNINCVEVAKICEKAGASAITLHARTRSQGYSGHSDWSLKRLKKV